MACEKLVPEEDRRSRWRYLETAGETQATIVFCDANGTHRVTISANVTQFYGTGCGPCAVSDPQRRGFDAAVGLGFLSALLALRVCRKRRS
jgi:hypothetical protein